MSSLSLLLVAVLGVALATAADMDASGNGVYVKTLGKSGKIMMASEENIAGSADRVTIEMDAVQEIDTDGDAIKGMSTKHSFNTFANQDFTFSSLLNGTLQNLTHSYFTFNAQLKDLASKVEVTVYIFGEAGTLEFGGETQEVSEGTVKWSIRLTDWEWCAPCAKGNKEYIGQYVDFTITVKGKKDVPENGTSADDTTSVDLGGGAMMKLSQKVQVGDAWVNIADGYPMSTTQGSKQMYTFRFAKDGAKDFFYDPSITYNTDPTPGAAGALVSSLALLTALLAVSLSF